MVSGKEQDGKLRVTIEVDDEDILSGEAIKRIQSSVAGGDQINPAMIELAAGWYVRIKQRSKNSSGRGVKKDMMRLRDQFLGLAEKIDTLPLEVSLMLLVSQHFFPQSDEGKKAHKPDEISEMLRNFANSLDQFVQAAQNPMTGLDQSINLTLSMLEIGYRRGTGRAATHSSNRNGEHQSRPLSEFGGLSVAFFVEVDPTVTAVSLTTHVRHFVKTNKLGSLIE